MTDALRKAIAEYAANGGAWFDAGHRRALRARLGAASVTCSDGAVYCVESVVPPGTTRRKYQVLRINVDRSRVVGIGRRDKRRPQQWPGGLDESDAWRRYYDDPRDAARAMRAAAQRYEDAAVIAAGFVAMGAPPLRVVGRRVLGAGGAIVAHVRGDSFMAADLALLSPEWRRYGVTFSPAGTADDEYNDPIELWATSDAAALLLVDACYGGFPAVDEIVTTTRSVRAARGED